ncbi:hypothetical protein ACFZDK_20830 [Streptomyces sp. NPDC007901]|uniref:hypothetical protein n=1 Tax=Streptomyces sp. NPDC007901 TaxID=3364785 RepID=UPI0036F0CC4C
MDLLTADARATAASRAAGGDTFSGPMEAEVSRGVLGARAHGLEPFFDGGE